MDYMNKFIKNINFVYYEKIFFLMVGNVGYDELIQKHPRHLLRGRE